MEEFKQITKNIEEFKQISRNSIKYPGIQSNIEEFLSFSIKIHSFSMKFLSFSIKFLSFSITFVSFSIKFNCSSPERERERERVEKYSRNISTNFLKKFWYLRRSTFFSYNFRSRIASRFYWKIVNAYCSNTFFSINLLEFLLKKLLEIAKCLL